MAHALYVGQNNMPEKAFMERIPNNVPGRFYTDEQCLDCDLCREIAPSVFARNDNDGSLRYEAAFNVGRA
jgi:hypothetical protein